MLDYTMNLQFSDNKSSRTYREHDLDTSGEFLFSIDTPAASYDNKPRGKAYREILAGLRYHKGEKLSLVTIGFKRGSTIDTRDVLMKLTTWIKRVTEIRIDYYRVTVYENNSPTEQWRIHIHMIWNAPYLKQSAILEKVETYIGENGHVYITLLDGDEKKTARYLMQYLGNQDGFVRYSHSRNWLPKNYSDEWRALKQDFFSYVPCGIRKPMDDPESVMMLIIQKDETWRHEGLIENMNLWIDEQRFAKEQHAEVNAWQKK